MVKLTKKRNKGQKNEDCGRMADWKLTILAALERAAESELD